MTMFSQKSFSVAEKPGTPEEERARQLAWARTFPNSCLPCAEQDWPQLPMKNKSCPKCGKSFCAEHMEGHTCAP